MNQAVATKLEQANKVMDELKAKADEAGFVTERNPGSLTITFPRDFDLWRDQVNARFQHRTSCTWHDLSGDDDMLRSSYEAGEAANEFVEWYIEKYGLDTTDEINFGIPDNFEE